MSHNWQHSVVHAAAHDKNSKAGALVLVVMGFFFVPVLIGIPMMAVGLHRLMK